MKNNFLKLRARYSLIKIKNLSFPGLELINIKSSASGPIIWLTAGIHGDEISGSFIIKKFFQKLEKDNLLIKGAVYSLPRLNPFALKEKSRNIPISNEDLNRAFPGRKNGTIAEKIAAVVFSEIKKTRPTLILDFHNDWQKSLSYVVLDPYPGKKHHKVYQQAEGFARETGFLAIREKDEKLGISEMKKSLTGSLLLQGTAALTLEFGDLGLEKNNIQKGIAAIFNILNYLKMIKPLKKNFIDDFPIFLQKKILKYSEEPVCSKKGIIKFFVKPGEIVKKNQLLAKIYSDPGQLKEILKARNKNIILGLSDSRVASPGLAIISSGTIK